MDAPAGQLPDEPCFYCSKQQIAALGALTCTGDIFQQPVEFCAREVGVDHKAGFCPEYLGQSLFLEAVTVFACAAALPDDGVVNRLAGMLIPHDGGLALVCDADGGNVGGGCTDLLHGLNGNAKLCCPDFICIVLNPAGLWEVLREFALCDAAHFAVLVKQNTAI